MLININELEDVQVSRSLKHLRIDVGLAGDAPNSALWLKETTDRLVIGVEPLDYHWRHLYKLGSPDGESKTNPWYILELETDSVVINGTKVCDINNRFIGIRGAIDNTNQPKEQSFYKNKTGYTGSSSLLKQNITDRFEQEIKINTFSLEYLIDNLPKKFDYIEHIKTDCEGKDFDVVKSIGKYLSNIVFISSEVRNNNPNEWIGTQNPNEFITYMRDNNFEILTDHNNNIDFVNKLYKEEIKINNLTNHIVGM